MKTKKFLQLIKTLLFSTALLLTAFSSLATTDSNNLQTLQLSYYFESPLISTIEIEDSIYDRVTLVDCYTAGNPGEPNIPSKGAYILLPPNSEPSSIQVEAKNKISLGFGFNIDPIGQPIPISSAVTITAPKKDEQIYAENDFYPKELFSKVGVYSSKGYDILVLLLHPMHYNPVNGELLFYKELKVNVETISNEKQNLFRDLEKDKIEVKNRVDNPDALELYSSCERTTPASFDSYDLLILTTDSLKSGFVPLKDAHDADGLNTIIKTITDVGSTNPDDIRDYIKDAYYNWGIDYVLLGGDNNIVPARTLYVFGLDEETTPYETYMPSDIYYSCLDGPYNYDGDEKWGEPTDGEGGSDVDLMSEVYVGRACVDNMNDVNNFVSKTVTYINQDPELDYLSNAGFAGEYMGDYGIATWGGNYLDQMIDICTDDGYTTKGVPSDNYTIDKLYDRDWPGNYWLYTDIMNIINDGVHFINHAGHASYDYDMKMYSWDVYDLTNDEYCFIYSQGCMSGGFDDPYGFDCIAEDFTVKTDTGAFAGIWNARYGWFWAYSTDGDSQRFQRQYWDAVFGENIPQIGKANSKSKEDNLAIIGRSCIRWVYYETNLFGDPSLSFYEIEENDPPNTPNIHGQTNGKTGETYEYCIDAAVDPDGDDIWVYWNWGDGTNSGWLGPYASGEEICESHTWAEDGTYTIKAKLKDEYSVESDWGTLEVTMPRAKAFNRFLQGLFDLFPNALPILRQILEL